MSFQKIMDYVQEHYEDSVGHSNQHTYRVLKNAIEIAENCDENVDLFKLKIMVFLHDIMRIHEDNDNRLNKIDHAVRGAQESKKILLYLGFEKDFAEEIADGILTHRFRSGNEPKSIEAKILFDADKLDSMGVIGIARSLMIAGAYHQEISTMRAGSYPQESNTQLSLEEYKKENIDENGRIKNNSKHNPIMEWKLKLCYIKDRMMTEYGKKLASEKFEYMKNFYEELEKESNIDIKSLKL